MRKLHVDSIRKRFNTKQVLTDVYISCEIGEIIGLLGRNGTGKSTLLKIIFGSLSAESKFVKVGDRILNEFFNHSRLIKYLPQHHFIPDHIKVENTVGLFCDREKAGLLKSHDLILPLLNKKIKQLSDGERRLFEILLVVFSDSTFTLLDEPFNGIAPVYKDEIKELIKVQSGNKGFIITDHDYTNILDLATRIIVIHDGGTKEVKSKDDLKYWGYLPETA